MLSSHLLLHIPSHFLLHLLIFKSSLTSAHLHFCSSSHLLSHTVSPSHLSFLSPFSLSPSLFSLLRRRVVPAASHETSTLSHKMTVDRQKLRENAIWLVPEQPFRTKWVLIVKNWGKIFILLVPEQPFRTKWGLVVKKRGKIAIFLSGSNCHFTCAKTTLSHEMRVDRQKLRKICDFTFPGATLSHEMRVDRQKLS